MKLSYWSGAQTGIYKAIEISYELQLETTILRISMWSEWIFGSFPPITIFHVDFLPPVNTTFYKHIFSDSLFYATSLLVKIMFLQSYKNSSENDSENVGSTSVLTIDVCLSPVLGVLVFLPRCWIILDNLQFPAKILDFFICYQDLGFLRFLAKILAINLAKKSKIMPVEFREENHSWFYN